jgi:acetyl-CoA carboxylase carboxyl transferase subunit alpha
MSVLDFEKPIVELRSKIKDLKRLLDEKEMSLDEEIKRLEERATQLEKETFSKLTAWQKTQLARHPQRPYTLDFVEHCTETFEELSGDRSFADDQALVGGIGTMQGKAYMIIGHQKGRNTSDKVRRNFGMPHPEGYRKALRLMKLADKFRLPILTLIDTPGAFPGIGAEERGQAEAIAVNLREMMMLRVPIVSVVIGEGGSGGALALGVGNRILMFEHSIYSVISPEGCAGILWHDKNRASEAAESLKYTAQDLIKFKLIDQIVAEPRGGAHIHPEQAMGNLRKSIMRHFNQLRKLNEEELLEQRYWKFRKMGVFIENN